MPEKYPLNLQFESDVSMLACSFLIESSSKLFLKAKFQCHPARCLLPVEIMQRCGLATGPATVELLPYLLPY